MSKKIFKACLKLQALTAYPDQAEFVDKTAGYLYSTYKFKEIKLIPKDSAQYDFTKFPASHTLFMTTNQGVFTVFNRDKLAGVYDIRECVLLLSSSLKSKTLLILKWDKSFSLTKKLKGLEQFLLFLGDYYSRTLLNFEKLEQSKQTEPEPELPTASRLQRIDFTTPHLGTSRFEAEDPADTTPGSFFSYQVRKMPTDVDMENILKRFEKAMIREMLKRCDGKKAVAAKRLGITERMIGYKVKQLGLE